MKLLSVGIPCYNSMAYMDKAIDSVLVCREDVEIIIVNDVRELMKELHAVGRNLNQLTTRANMKQLEVVDLKPTYLELVEIYTVLTELLKRVKG